MLTCTGQLLCWDMQAMIHKLRQMPALDAGSADRLDPRLLVLGALLLIVLIISSNRPWFPFICLAGAVVGGVATGARLRLLVGRLGNPLLIACFLLLIKSVAVPDGQSRLAGLEEGVLLASRVLGAASVMMLLGHLVSVTEMLGALAWLRLPRTLVEIAFLAWRYLFVLLDDASIVYGAQRNRLGYSGMRRGLRSFGSLAGVLAVKAFDASRTITVAMTQRGYDGSLPLALPQRLSSRQSALLALFAGMAIVLWYAQNYGV